MRNFNIPAIQDAVIAVQKEGRMTAGSINWLNENVGTDFPLGPTPFKDTARRRLTDSSTGITIVGRSNGDNLKELATGRADLAIAGGDKLGEVASQDNNPFGFKTVLPLGFATCRLVFARQIGTQDDSRTVATSYPRQARNYLDQRGRMVPVSYYGGGVEMIARENDYNLVDIVDSGASLAANNFEEVETLAQSEAMLIGIENSQTQDPEVYDLITRGGSIEDMLARRLALRRIAPTDSLASRVINDPTGNLGIKKLGEEMAEVVKAIIEGDRAETITELADASFWLLANGVRLGIGSVEIKQELQTRYIEGS